MDKVELLTAREEELVSLLFQGKTKRVIAEMFDTTEQVVKNMLRPIFRKLEIASVAELLATAYLEGGFNLWSPTPAASVDPSLLTYSMDPRKRDTSERYKKVELWGMKLTPQEAYLCRLYRAYPNLTIKQLSTRMGVSVHACRSMFARIYPKAGVNRRPELYEVLYDRGRAQHASQHRNNAPVRSQGAQLHSAQTGAGQTVHVADRRST